MDLTLFLTTLIGGILVILSYFIFLPKNKFPKGGYLKSEYWVGIPKNMIYVLFMFQLLAVLGFFMFMVPWIFKNKPKQGLFSYNKYILPITVGIFMLFSILWSIGITYTIRDNTSFFKFLTVFSLIIVSICSILFIAGAAEDKKGEWFVLLGTILLGITTIISDGVIWNANFIKNYIN